jgi:hypothetical protein
MWQVRLFVLQQCQALVLRKGDPLRHYFRAPADGFLRSQVTQRQSYESGDHDDRRVRDALAHFGSRSGVRALCPCLSERATRVRR